jgi:predicted porin
MISILALVETAAMNRVNCWVAAGFRPKRGLRQYGSRLIARGARMAGNLILDVRAGGAAPSRKPSAEDRAMTTAIRSAAGGFVFCSLVIPAGLPVTSVAAPLDTSVTCVSTDGNRQHCPGATDAGVALRRSIGSSNCLLGRNWGYDASGVWVTEGCGGVFELGNPAHETERLAAQSGTPGPDDRILVGESTVAEEPSGATTSLGDYAVYTRLGAQLATIDGETEVQDARSRVGLRYSTGPDGRFFAAAEWSVNLTKNPSSLYPGESTSGGFLVLESSPGSVFGTRLGYVGVDFGERGKLTLGKQWGVHYDITSYTDIFNVFGAEASATFNAGTDGGFMGTGRADEALSYRNTFFDRLKVGAQVQLRDVTNGRGIDGYGASLRFDVLPGLELGGTYTKSQYSESIKSQLLGLQGDAEYAAAGVRYRTETLELAGVYATQKNGDLYRIPFDRELIPVVFDATGFELAGRYESGKLGLLAGYLVYRPDKGALLVDREAHLQYAIVGADYRWNPSALIFAEYRASSGISPLGTTTEDVFALGLQYSFAKLGSFDLD